MEECLDDHTSSGWDLISSKILCVGLNLKVLRGVSANEGFSFTSFF